MGSTSEVVGHLPRELSKILNDIEDLEQSSTRSVQSTCPVGVKGGKLKGMQILVKITMTLYKKVAIKIEKRMLKLGNVVKIVNE